MVPTNPARKCVPGQICLKKEAKLPMAPSNFANIEILCNEVLTSIELSEMKLLNWGFIDIFSDLQTQLPTMMEKLPSPGHELWLSAQKSGVIYTDILHNLIDRRLVFPAKASGRVLYRSRFAEAVRLLFLLRQRFSREDWQTASRLVSDLKINLQRRRYPRRDIPPSELLQELRDLRANPLYIKAVTRLLQDNDGNSLNLARFQKEAATRLYRNLHSRGDHAIVIGAGTGSGKTKAFYVPALAEIASSLTIRPWVQALAIYPRIELLKDQLAEALSEIQKLDALLRKQGKRSITLGAYYADTPISARVFDKGQYISWRASTDPEGWVCPFLSCPDPNCSSSDLVWLKKDIKQEKEANDQGIYGRFERLICPSCNFTVQGDQLLLTREHMKQQPPDILLTSTEMLNQRLGRAAEHHLFGIDTNDTPPRMVLLDEIHTYEGLHGAQIAYLLRRWRHARGHYPHANLCFVGLSATLTNAESFFSKLSGLPVHQVVYVKPEENDMTREGVEYNIVLKGDPVSGTSLLSTSVQTVMLLGRILDSKKNVSGGAYGRRIFAFTDKLDVINRWYHIELDAEKDKNLSQWRQVSPALDEETRRKIRLAGQDWQSCVEIGHALRKPLKVTKTSSQSRGVDPNAELVIATSTLEVGFNDPTVGAVIQHKAPRSIASFLQRKGRAGRPRGMRPWMVVVTSAYGRDRWAFQHAEQLFDPLLEDINLPLDSYYVRKIQATFALLDWLSLLMKREKGERWIDIWKLLGGKGKSVDELRQRKITSIILEEVLTGSRRAAFTRYIQEALGIQDQGALDSVLWYEPRSLLFEVIPTLLQKLSSDAQHLAEDGNENEDTSSHPLADFVPPALFADLNVAEILLHIPEVIIQSKKQKGQPFNSKQSQEYMPLHSCMNEFAPAHVSKRFSRSDLMQEAYWLALPEEAQMVQDTVELHLLDIELAGNPQDIVASGQHYRVFHPRSYTLRLIPSNVRNTSTGYLQWLSSFATISEGRTEEQDTNPSQAVYLPLAANSVWHHFVDSVRCYTQVNNTWVAVTRLAVGVQVDTRYTGTQPSRRQRLRFVESRERAALGFTTDVDALEFEFYPLDVQYVMTNPSWSDLYQHLGPEYFLYKLQNDERIINANLSSFEISWLWQLELSMLVATAVAKQLPLPDAVALVCTDRPSLAERTMEVIFQSQQLDEPEGKEKFGHLHDRLVELVKDQEIQQALTDNERVLWDWHDATLPYWLQQCYASSMGATLFTALSRFVPDIDPDDLVLDVNEHTIWISEMTPGGIGLISKIADALTLRPREFELQMLDTLQNCDRDLLATQLRAVAHLVEQSDQELLDAFTSMRNEVDLLRQEETRRRLTAILERHAITTTRELVVTLQAKFLRSNSSKYSDQLIATFVKRWEQEEQRIGCAIDLRVMAVAALKLPEIKNQVNDLLKRIGGTTKVDEPQLFNLLQSLLWFRCHDSCPDCIEKQHPYQQLIRPSRTLLLMLLNRHEQKIAYGSPDWKEQVQHLLSSIYSAQLGCEQELLEECKKSLLSMLFEPVEIGFQFFYPFIERITRNGRHWTIGLSIREFTNASS
jgi:DEAD/DEAH box helicase/Helicase conserved C-terminal domain